MPHSKEYLLPKFSNDLWLVVSRVKGWLFAYWLSSQSTRVIMEILYEEAEVGNWLDNIKGLNKSIVGWANSDKIKEN